MIRYWDKKILDIKSWYSLPPSPLLSIKFFDTRNFAKHRRFPLRSFFGTLRQQIFNRKSWYSPLWHKIFQYVKLSETQKGSTTNWFGTVRQKFWHEIVILPPSFPSPLVHEVFRYQKFCETQKVSPTKFFGTVRQQIFYRKSWYSPFRHKIFRYVKLSDARIPLRNDSVLRQNFWNTEGFLYEIFRYCETTVFL